MLPCLACTYIRSWVYVCWKVCLKDCSVNLVIEFGPSLDLGTLAMKHQSTGCPEKKMMHLVLAEIENINSNLNGMEWSFQSGQNGMTSFHSSRNGELIPFWLEWNGHSIPAGMEWSHSIPSGMEWALHSGRNGHSNPAGMECHSFDNLKKYAPL